MAKGKERITLVGAGNLARTLVEVLPAAGYKLDEIVTRNVSRPAISLSRRCGARHATLKTAQFPGDVVWLAVSDSAIRTCAEQIAESAAWKNKVVLHSSGALSSDELKSLRERGASVASAHPMMTFVAGEAPRLEGLAWTVEGDRKAVLVARKIVRELGGAPFEIKKKDKSLYHAFGAFLSPLLVVHLSAAAEVARAAGIPRNKVAVFMTPIVRQTLENFFTHLAEKEGGAKAFSGPLARGDVGTIERHLKALRKMPGPDQLYRALVKAAVDSHLPVRKRGSIGRLVR